MPLYIYAINGVVWYWWCLHCHFWLHLQGKVRPEKLLKALGAQAPGEGPSLGNTSGTRHLMEHNIQGSRSGETGWASITYLLFMR